MKRMLKFSPVLAPLALAFSSAVSAGPLGLSGPQDFIVRVGGTYISPRQDQVSFVDDSFQFFDAFRTTVDPDSEWGWNINLEWKPVEHWGIELAYINGDRHSGGNADGYFSFAFEDFDIGEVEFGDVATYEADISTASLKFYPLDDTCMVQPYIGGGISYTDFSSTRFSRSARDGLAEFGLRGNFDMGYSWGYTWQAGIDFNFGRESSWLVNVAAVYARSVTDMRLQFFDDVPPADLAPPLESYSGDYIYDPWMFNLSVGYKFSF